MLGWKTLRRGANTINQQTHSDVCRQFWRELKVRIARFDELDPGDMVFGARTRGVGHHYKILPQVAESTVIHFEKTNQLELPPEYRTYLLEFGAGGAGPDYGIYDFNEVLLPKQVTGSFPYAEEIWYEEVTDDDPIWDYPGMVYIADHGCGAGYLLELNGPNPGTVWCDWSDACSPVGSFLKWYRGWADKVEAGLERFHLLKSFIDPDTHKLIPRGLTLQTLIENLGCDFSVRDNSDSSKVEEGTRWIHFDQTPARVIVNERDQVMQIDLYLSCSIT